MWDLGLLVPAFAATATTFVAGLAIAIAFGSALGIAVGAFRPAGRALGPRVEFMRAVPPPVTVPVASLLLGYGTGMKFAVVVLSALWPVLLNAALAAARVEPLLIDVGATLRLSRARFVTEVVVSSAVPAILVGTPVAISLAIVVTLLVEMLTACRASAR